MRAGARGGQSRLEVIFALALCALASTACQKQKSEQGERELSPAEQSALSAALVTYADIACAAFADSALGARALSKKADEFLRAPSAGGFAELRSVCVRSAAKAKRALSPGACSPIEQALTIIRAHVLFPL